MGYIRVGWPDSQRLMELEDNELEELGIELAAEK